MAMKLAGKLKNLLSLEALSRQQLLSLLDDAETFARPPGAPPARGRDLHGRTVANLFFEASTRTRASFELAARRLGADVLTLDIATSSRNKGETDIDTLHTLAAMGASIFIVRSGVAGLPARLARELNEHCGLINAGEAELAHPTQGLLDVMTIRRHKPGVESLRVAIVGDIAHSRVARSVVRGLLLLGIEELRLVGPESFLPDAGEMPGVTLTNDLQEGLAGADVVMALRIQRERMAAADMPDTGEYFQRFGLSEDKLAVAAPDAIVMHPGPMNRGVEIDSALADGPRSVIREQVANGVAVRMALLATIAQTLDAHTQQGAP